jgi:hypothetical protein
LPSLCTHPGTDEPSEDQVTLPEATTPAGHGIVIRSEKQLIARELGRDYLPTRRITRNQTDLAA